MEQHSLNKLSLVGSRLTLVFHIKGADLLTRRIHTKGTIILTQTNIRILVLSKVELLLIEVETEICTVSPSSVLGRIR